MIRACILIGTYPPEFSGHGIQIERMLPHLRANGVEPTVVAYRPAAPPSGVVPRDEPGVLRLLAPRRARLAALRHTLGLRRFFRRRAGDFDVVHTTLHGWELFLNLRSIQRRGLPVVYEMVLLGTDDPVTVSRLWLGRVKLSLLRSAEAWVGITESFRPTLVAAGIPDERFHCIYCGVDLERYRPTGDGERARERAALGLPLDARVVVTAGALVPRKGMDRVLCAWARLAPKPGRDALLLIGPASVTEGLPPGGANYVAELRALATALGVSDTVRFVGRVGDLERWYAASDVFVFLSRREGQGTVIVEAMASGLPCVVSPLDGIGQELLADGGVVVDDPDDAAAVAARIGELLDDAPRRRVLGVRARQRAEARFSMQARARAFAELYRELAQRRRG